MGKVEERRVGTNKIFPIKWRLRKKSCKLGDLIRERQHFRACPSLLSLPLVFFQTIAPPFFLISFISFWQSHIFSLFHLPVPSPTLPSSLLILPPLCSSSTSPLSSPFLPPYFPFFSSKRALLLLPLFFILPLCPYSLPYCHSLSPSLRSFSLPWHREIENVHIYMNRWCWGCCKGRRVADDGDSEAAQHFIGFAAPPIYKDLTSVQEVSRVLVDTQSYLYVVCPRCCVHY